jgi:predicted  nucleic acid-binding Zn-ribbon protein
VERDAVVSQNACDETYQARRAEVLSAVEARYAEFFDLEMDKLDNWADDKRKGLKYNLKDLDDQLKELKKEIRQASSLPDKLALQRQARKIESRRDEAWREYDQQAREIETKKDQLLDSVEEKLATEISDEKLFAISWSVA